MPFTAYLSNDQITDLHGATVAAGLAESTTLSALADGIPLAFKALLPDGGAPAVRLLQTLNRLNTTEKLDSGQVPFAIWLRNAVTLGAGVPQQAVFRGALDEISGEISGEEPIDNVAALPELQDEVLEKVVHYNDLLPYGFLRLGEAAGLGVARIEVPRFEGGQPILLNDGKPNITLGTAWLIAPDLVVTNQHVVKARPRREQPSPNDFKVQAENATVRFDYEIEGNVGTPVDARALELSDIGLDVTILRLAQEPPQPATGARKPLRTSRQRLIMDPNSGERRAVNIIQHPFGDPKQVACRNNLVSEGGNDSLRYFTDTRSGSSGSPVLDDDWEVVALHRASTDVKNVVYQGMPVPWLNIGTQMGAIIDHIEHNEPNLFAEIDAAQQALGSSTWLV